MYLFSKFRGIGMNITYSPAALFHTCSMHLNTNKIKVIEMLFIITVWHGMEKTNLVKKGLQCVVIIDVIKTIRRKNMFDTNKTTK